VVLLEPETLKKRQKKVPNTPAGFQVLIAWCQQQTGITPAELHAVMEATGSYHEVQAHALHDAGLVVSVINPKVVKDFAKGLGIKAKHDASEAVAPRTGRK
jgi:transposase